MIDNILIRVNTRLAGDEACSLAAVSELCQEVLDRLCIRLGVTEESFPVLFHSIAVDATVKCVRRVYYEGISSENIGGMQVSFVDDVLAEYDDEIGRYVKSSGTYGKKGVKFL